MLAILVAALCHDVGHDGFNNRYHVVTKSHLYQMYGAEHVQENLHAALTLRQLETPEYDFLTGKLSQSDIRIIKKRMMTSILFTDMATMQKLRDEFQAHLDKFGITNTKNRDKLIDTTSPATVEYSKQLVSSCVLHGCDISTSLREFDLSA